MNDSRATIFVYRRAVLCHLRTGTEGVFVLVAGHCHCIVFIVHGVTRFELSLASLDPVPGERAWNALAAYTCAEWAAIRRDELGSRVIACRAVTAEGNAVPARAFSVLDTHRLAEYSPSVRYAGLLRQGAHGIGLPPEVWWLVTWRSSAVAVGCRSPGWPGSNRC